VFLCFRWVDRGNGEQRIRGFATRWRIHEASSSSANERSRRRRRAMRSQDNIVIRPRKIRIRSCAKSDSVTKRRHAPRIARRSASWDEGRVCATPRPLTFPIREQCHLTLGWLLLRSYVLLERLLWLTKRIENHRREFVDRASVSDSTRSENRQDIAILLCPRFPLRRESVSRVSLAESRAFENCGHKSSARTQCAVVKN